MSRRRRAEKRSVLPDAKYGDIIITKFINRLMYHGKKSVAEAIVYSALAIVGEREKTDAPQEVFYKALEAVRPLLEVKSRRVGGATYQVPVEVSKDRGLNLAMSWIINDARQRSGKNMTEKLAAAILDANGKRGAAVKKREDTHKMAEANRAFAHYRW